MTLIRRIETAANNKDVLEVIEELVKRQEQDTNTIDKIEKRVEVLEKEQEKILDPAKKPGFFD